MPLYMRREGSSKSNIYSGAFPPCHSRPGVHIKMDLFLTAFNLKTVVRMVCNWSSKPGCIRFAVLVHNFQ